MSADPRRLLDDPVLSRVLALLNGDGEEARVVGGAVRNALLARPATDVDIATTAVPDVVIARAKRAGLRIIPTGIAHGTVTVRLDGRGFEVTTLREDIETDGRHARIRYGRDFSLDALRRDFTINALSMGPDGAIHDYADGLADVAAGRVRFIGDPATRIREDFLRILRFFRFSADYAAGDLDADGRRACVRERAGLVQLSRERIWQELAKLLVARRAAGVARIMAGDGLLGPLLRSAPQPMRLAGIIALDRLGDPVLRLAALAAVVPEDAARLRDALRLSNADTAHIEAATRVRTRLHGAGTRSPRLLRELLFDFGRIGATDGLRLAWAECAAGSDDANWTSALAFLHDTPEPRLPFSAADLVARGVAPGRPIGVALKRLQAEWIRAGFPQDPRTLGDLLAAATRGRPD